MSRWYRAYEGTVTDAKLSEAAMLAEVSRSVAIATWHAILENAACVNNGGEINIPSRRIAAVLVEPFGKIEGLFLAFEAIGLIKGSVIVSWQRRQFESDSSTERSRRHREGKRNADATLQQQHATPPETETETEEKNANAFSSESASEKQVLKPEHVVEAWNTMATRKGLPQVSRLTNGRMVKLKARIREHSVDDFTEAIAAVERSPFLCGEGERTWRADFDFLLQPKSFQKLIEGSYDR